MLKRVIVDFRQGTRYTGRCVKVVRLAQDVFLSLSVRNVVAASVASCLLTIGCIFMRHQVDQSTQNAQ